ncbi:MAG: prephenate dehydratase [Halobacteriales archaeon]
MTPTQIGTLGPAGTYSHRAASRLGDDISFYDGVPEIADAVERGDVERGVVPVENSIEGSVNATLDVLVEYDLYVVGEVVVDVEHALLAQDEEFDVVASHPQALAQCRGYLRDRYPDAELRSVSSTAAGVEEAREDASVAAIAHPSLADETVWVLDESVQDADGNSTRFVVLAREPADGGGKTSIVVYPGADRPGLLYDILGVFKDRGVNLTRIESRPSKRELGDYVFHIDFEGGSDDADGILDALDEHVEWVEFLGSYDRVD